MKTNKPIVLQLIDSLAGGGAERVSVNLANALSKVGVKSFLCATRNSGPLEQFIDPNVKKLILDKRSSIDVKAIYTLVKFIKENEINIIHAHSSSFFMAVLCKLFVNVKVVWHDHYGKAEQLNQRPVGAIRKASYFFDYVISVNKKLAHWSKENLYIKNKQVLFLQNFAQLSFQDSSPELPGTKKTRIVCLANLRPQKDHITLLKAFKEILPSHADWHLLLVGQDSDNDYSSLIKKYVQEQSLERNVHILGSRNDTADILFNSTIGVLSSESEGLPVALLEYGLAKLPVVSTDVGQCGDVLGYSKFGKVVPVKDYDVLAKSMEELIINEKTRESLALKFHNRVLKNYSQEAVVAQLIKIYQGILHG